MAVGMVVEGAAPAILILAVPPASSFARKTKRAGFLCTLKGKLRRIFRKQSHSRPARTDGKLTRHGLLASESIAAIFISSRKDASLSNRPSKLARGRPTAFFPTRPGRCPIGIGRSNRLTAAVQDGRPG